MCFSASASFIAAGILAGIGVGTLYSTTQKSYLLLALTPLLFAIQQAAEGVVWLTISDPTSLLCQAATYSFLFFAGILWPIWSPLGVFLSETDPWRRIILMGFIAGGTVIAGYALWLFLCSPLQAHVISCSIDYSIAYYTPQYPSLTLGLYTLATVGPFFASKLKYAWSLGILWLIALFVTLFFKYETATSVWCFFAAFISILLCWVIRKN